MSEASPTEEEVIFHNREKLQVIILNRPHALNALTLSMIKQIREKLQTCLNDNMTDIVILKGNGDRAFCSGGDLKAITSSAKQGGNYGQQYFYHEFGMNYLIGTYPKPLISILHGITFGGAAGLTVIGRFCVVTEQALFCMPECAIGLFPDVGSGYFLSRLPGNLGLYLGLTGFRLKGVEIVNEGLASHYIHSSKLGDLERSLKSLTSPVKVDDVRLLLDQYQEKSLSLNTHHTNDKSAIEEHREQIRSCFSGNSVEDVIDNLHKDGSDWTHEQIESLQKMSPTSLKLTFRLLKEGINKTLVENLKTEYRLTQRCVEDKDFHEGIRAYILDKDRKPQWDPPTLEAVSEERINSYFAPFFQPVSELCLDENSVSLL